jgi:hypothetical protein
MEVQGCGCVREALTTQSGIAIVLRSLREAQEGPNILHLQNVEDYQSILVVASERTR